MRDLRTGQFFDDRLASELDEAEVRALEMAGMPDDEPQYKAPSLAQRGRGATSNPPVRFEPRQAGPFDDGWNTMAAEFLDECGGALPPQRTTLTRDATRSVISWNTSPDLGFDRAVNPYRGCEHGCVYCFARPTHAYLGHSPGLDFETKLHFKPDVADLLDKELRKPGYVPRTMALGTNTDPYQPVERGLKLTRCVLEVLERFNHPVSIVTKSAGVLRDLDILSRLASRNLVRVYVSITTLDPTLARRMEPRAATPERRLQTVRTLTQARVPAGILAAPMIPGLNDSELERILESASRAGAQSAGYVLLRLPHELKELFEDWLAHHYPDRARHVLNLIRNTRAGSLNDPRFHARFVGAGAYADLLARRFSRAARQWGFGSTAPLDCTAFAVPPTPKAERGTLQMSLF